MIGMLKSLWAVGRKLLAPTQTQLYPEEQPLLAPRYRGRIILSRDPDGAERCVACNLCAVVCPVDCIEVVKAETVEGRWYPETFRINFARCIFCGLCEEACPTAAIQLTPDFELADYARASLVYDKPDLLIAGTGKYPGYRYWDVAGKAQPAPPSVDVKGLEP
ncbi:NADH-quinone oxidoreductase subunit NuoI [Polymorphobacter fuscus]|uniref:NADH-quinone oxidoreductase subunit I n=1 Tax=Sandarakinorhabdus fusca TaxID=1439888 RepID=A0A7C9KNQ1_9SPHN|nr:NADH-quinone oxidoreductase subunit NuoI [Polymorphobacter fuscus]MQT18683.1 NADH-quinone oxidoreductase subunit NuoI [Polymorphobacter fuscus]NJC08100.1 NADH-quinone oxidoreductase subunit I [Polymorphobacter fuscus]